MIVQRRARSGRWRTADSDLGLRILWTVDESGQYQAFWESPPNARLGLYRFKIHANDYRLKSKRFRLRPARDLEARLADVSAGRAVIELRYPQPVENVDLTWRPKRATIGGASLTGGSVDVRGRRIVVTGEPGEKVRVPRGALRDRHGNRNGNVLSVELRRP